MRIGEFAQVIVGKIRARSVREGRHYEIDVSSGVARFAERIADDARGPSGRQIDKYFSAFSRAPK